MRIPTSIALMLILTAWVIPAFAADAAPFSRQTYDQMMRYINFVILVVLILKYARRPIANFLRDKKQEVAGAIERLEAQKQQIEDQIHEGRIQLAAGQQRLVLIKDKIISDGQKQRDRIIAEAQQDARLLLESARRKIETRIRDTQNQLRRELIEMASAMASDKLLAAVTSADQEVLLQQWFDAAAEQSV